MPENNSNNKGKKKGKGKSNNNNSKPNNSNKQKKKGTNNDKVIKDPTFQSISRDVSKVLKSTPLSDASVNARLQLAKVLLPGGYNGLIPIGAPKAPRNGGRGYRPRTNFGNENKPFLAIVDKGNKKFIVTTIVYSKQMKHTQKELSDAITDVYTREAEVLQGISTDNILSIDTSKGTGYVFVTVNAEGATKVRVGKNMSNFKDQPTDNNTENAEEEE